MIRPLSRMISLMTMLAMILLIPALGTAALTAVERDAADAVVRNWLQFSGEMQWSDSRHAAAAPVLDVFHEGQRVGYVAMLDGGFVVLPAYAELPPVTAYSYTSPFITTEEDGFVAMIKEALADKIDIAQTVLNASQITSEMEDAAAQIARDRELWQAYPADYETFRRSVIAHSGAGGLDDVMSVGPLLQTVWKQTVPYNNFCPMGDGGRTVVGCVATAAAQILAYWHSPASGTGSRSYTWNGDQSCGGSTPSQALSATFSDGYDWANMLNAYITGYTQAQADAVAELCYEVGVALSMDYGRCGSGSATSLVASVLPQYFGMSSGINVQYRTAYATADAWFAMLRADLDALRPIQYRIQSHSIVCDGWRISGGNQVHMNYGWANGYTAWYTVDALHCPWSGCGPSAEYAVRNIQPAGNPPPPAVVLSTPNGGESLATYSSCTVTWTSSNFPENVALEINRSYPSGTWELITGNTANDGSHTWTVNGAESSAARVRVRGVATVTVGDTSNANFAIVAGAPPVPVITVTAPNGGESWMVGANRNITWTSQNLNESVAIELNRSYPSGTWEVLNGSVANTGSWTWTLAGAVTSTARIRVRGVSQNAADSSNANFSIAANTQPYIAVLAPNGGEIVSVNTPLSIRWNSSGVSGNVKIQIKRNYPSGNWQTIVNNTPNDGQYTWQVTGPVAASARIRISKSSYSDESDASFQIGNLQYATDPLPERTRLESVYPNPFNPATQIRYHLAAAGRVRVDVFDPTGRQVKVLVDADQPAGEQSVVFDGRGLGAGIYFVRFQSGNTRDLRKLYLLK